MLKIDSTSGELIQIKFEIKPIKQKNIKIYIKKRIVQTSQCLFMKITNTKKPRISF